MAKLLSGTRVYGNLTIDTFVTAAGNVTGGNILSAGLTSITGNITGGNLLTGGLISSTGNITSAANVAGFTELKQKASEFDNGPGRAVVKPVYDDPFADKLTEIKTKQNPSMTEGASVRLDVLPYRFVRNAAYKPYKKSNKKRPGKRRKS